MDDKQLPEFCTSHASRSSPKVTEPVISNTSADIVVHGVLGLNVSNDVVASTFHLKFHHYTDSLPPVERVTAKVTSKSDSS